MPALVCFSTRLLFGSYLISIYHNADDLAGKPAHSFTITKALSGIQTSTRGSLGLGIDEERRTERYLWQRASALCELSILEYLWVQTRGLYRVKRLT